METKELTALDLAEVEYEKAEESLNEQRYSVRQIETAIEALEEYLEPSNERDIIKTEFVKQLEAARTQLLCCETRVASAARDLIWQKEKAING